MEKISIIGASGYTGAELLMYFIYPSRNRNPILKSSETYSSCPIAEVFPALRGIYKQSLQSMESVEMALIGTVNTRLVSLLNAKGVLAVGMHGKDAGLLRAKKYAKEDLGFVGEIEAVSPSLIHALQAWGFLPLGAPIAAGPGGGKL